MIFHPLIKGLQQWRFMARLEGLDHAHTFFLPNEDSPTYHFIAWPKLNGQWAPKLPETLHNSRIITSASLVTIATDWTNGEKPMIIAWRNRL